MATVKLNPSTDPKSDPIINCHTHVFTADHVPPWLGKTFLPLFLAYILTTPLIVVPARWWYRFGPRNWKHNYLYRLLRKWYYMAKILIDRIFILWLIVVAAGVILSIHVFFIIYDLLMRFFETDKEGSIDKIRLWLRDYHLLYPTEKVWLDALFVLVLMLFFPSGRNIIFLILKHLFKFLAALPDQTTRSYLARYWSIGRFAFYIRQRDIFRRLYDQYPEGTKFVILPMDMEYMGAGSPPENYINQLNKLAVIKRNHKGKAYPFVFVDPRRIADPGQKDFFKYSIGDDGTLSLEECVIRTFIEDKEFSGFKIYPALGYFPFDAHLLPLWVYAAQKNLPILTHCIRGTIFYRGIKESSWDYHPVFEQVMKEKTYDSLLLPEIKNADFSNNFTHPLNYLCLVEDSLLQKLLLREEYRTVRPVFYDSKGNFRNSLKDLKICLAHFGGEDEWQKYFELDRDEHSAQLAKHPDVGINFFELADGSGQSRGKIEQIWKRTDWYSIICSMILQKNNIYADISYIIHDDEIVPLLQQTIKNPKLRTKVLFGTDFYVVRNHKSEREILAEIMGRLSKDDFDQIARTNPKEFLKNVWTD